MPNRTLNDYDIESLRRSLAMLQTNQLALTRDQAMELVDNRISSRAESRQLRDKLEASEQA